MIFFFLIPFIISFFCDNTFFFLSIFKTRFVLSFLRVLPIILCYVSMLRIHLPSSFMTIIFILFSFNHFSLILTLVLFHFYRRTCLRFFNNFTPTLISSLSNPARYRAILLLQLILNFLLLSLS